jgi:predicted alpha/beta-hydrolase family hydrolase
MNHPFMTTVAEELASRGIATLRYQFPLHGKTLESGRIPPKVAQGTVRPPSPKLRAPSGVVWSRAANRLADA